MKERDIFDRVQKAFSEAYRQRDEAPVGTGWEQRVMGRVREIGALDSGLAWTDLMERWFWKVAPVACTLILLLSVAIVLQLHFLSDAEIAKAFLEVPAYDSFLEVLGKS